MQDDRLTGTGPYLDRAWSCPVPDCPETEWSVLAPMCDAHQVRMTLTRD